MTKMTATQLDAHIESKDWDYIDTKYPGTEAYESHIGVLRIMFKVEDDPQCIVTLLNKNETEVWAQDRTSVWEQLFYAHSN